MHQLYQTISNVVGGGWSARRAGPITRPRASPAPALSPPRSPGDEEVLRLEREAEAEAAKKRRSRAAEEEEYERVVVVSNTNRDDSVIEAHTVEDAIAGMALAEAPLPTDRHAGEAPEGLLQGTPFTWCSRSSKVSREERCGDLRKKWSQKITEEKGKLRKPACLVLFIGVNLSSTREFQSLH